MGAAEQIDQENISVSDINYAQGVNPGVLTRIFEEQINLVVLQRGLSEGVNLYCQKLVESKPGFQLRSAVSHDITPYSLASLFPDLPGRESFAEDLHLLVDMYSYLFEMDEVGLRFQVLDRAMCPRFHVDKLGCRLVTTYQGGGTEWLANYGLDRSKLGAGSMGLSDELSGLYPGAESIQQVEAGDVVLLKGDGWFGNEGAGAVHRSPRVSMGDKRIVVTLDFA